MNRFQSQVLDFHRKLGQPIGSSPQIVDDRACLRIDLIREEAKETIAAIDARDLVGVADGVVDLIYVAIGAAIEFGLDLEPIFDIVHASNMRKVGGPVRSDGKILKPKGWVPPDVAGEIERQRREAEGWSGKCLTGKHGLDYQGQPCDLCAKATA